MSTQFPLVLKFQTELEYNLTAFRGQRLQEDMGVCSSSQMPLLCGAKVFVWKG